MNRISELVEIIKELGGEAYYKDICLAYEKKFRDSLSQEQKITIAKTLNENPELVFMNEDNSKWTLAIKKAKASIINEDASMLFCNIAYMKYYKGINENDKPYNGGKYIDVTGNAGEKNNFLPRPNGYTDGFAEPGFTSGGYNGGGTQRQIHIEKVNISAKGEDRLSDVLVIMCARSPITKKTTIVGWYENATVYRNVIHLMSNNGEQGWKTIECKNEDAHLIEEKNRTFIIPRASIDGIGFGQSNYWYADSNNAKELKKKVITYINEMKKIQRAN